MKKLFRRLLAWLHSLRRRDKIMYIGGSDTLPPPLPREEETEVIARLEQGDPQARQTLIERNLRLVVYIARRFENTGINIEDLISIGTIGPCCVCGGKLCHSLFKLYHIVGTFM